MVRLLTSPASEGAESRGHRIAAQRGHGGSALSQPSSLNSEPAHPVGPYLLGLRAWAFTGITPELLHEKNSGPWWQQCKQQLV